MVVTGSSGAWRKEISITSGWNTVRIPFEAFSGLDASTSKIGNDIVDVRFLIKREGGQNVWLEIDQVSFF